MGHLNSVSDAVEGNLTAENKNIQMPGGCAGGVGWGCVGWVCGVGGVDVTN